MAEEYNGWLNYETWAVNQWLSNDEALYQTTRELISMPTDQPYEKEQALRGFVEELCEPSLQDPSLMSDLLSKSLSRVDWSAIVEAYEYK